MGQICRWLLGGTAGASDEKTSSTPHFTYYTSDVLLRHLQFIKRLFTSDAQKSTWNGLAGLSTPEERTTQNEGQTVTGRPGHEHLLLVANSACAELRSKLDEVSW
jgi:hypothetical protein